MATPYDPQSQNNPTWRSHIFGFGGAALGPFGCYVTSFAMVASHYLGRQVTPVEMDNLLRAHGGYSPGSSNVFDDSIQRALPQIQLVRTYHCESIACDLNQLNMAKDEEQIIEVDYNPALAGVQTHFVRNFGYSAGKVIIDDAYDGVRRDMATKYGDPRKAIQKIMTYRVAGFLAPWDKPVVPPAPPVVVPAPPTDAQRLADAMAQVDALKAQLLASVQASAARDAKDMLRKNKAVELVGLF